MEPKKKKNDLYHHGILGMKWGVRRYQNYDGSYTSIGRKRYGVSDATSGAVVAKANTLAKSKISVNKLASQQQSKSSSGLEGDIQNAASKASKRLIKGSHSKSYNSQMIADKLGKPIMLKKEEIDDILSSGQKVNDLANQVLASGNKEAKTAMKTEAFKKDLDSRLFKDFGNGCDDQDYFDMIREEHVYDMLHEGKYTPKTEALCKQFYSAVDEYYSKCSTAATKIIDGFGDKKIVDLGAESVTYRDVVNSRILKDTDAAWVSYLARHNDDYLYEGIDMSGSDIYSMSDYNKKHG